MPTTRGRSSGTCLHVWLPTCVCSHRLQAEYFSFTSEFFILLQYDSFHMVSVAVYLADPVNIDSDENSSLRRYASLLRGKLSLFGATNVKPFPPLSIEAKSPLSWTQQPSALKTWPTMSWGAIPCWMWLRLGPNSKISLTMS